MVVICKSWEKQVLENTKDIKELQNREDVDVTEINQQLARTLKTPLQRPSDTEIVAVDNTNAQVMLGLGAGLSIESGKLTAGGLTNLLSEPVYVDSDLSGYEWSNNNNPDLFSPIGVTKSQAVKDILKQEGDEKPYMITIASDYALFGGANLIVINGYGAITAPQYMMTEYGYYSTVQVGIQNGNIYAATGTVDPLKVLAIYRLA